MRVGLVFGGSPLLSEGFGLKALTYLEYTRLMVTTAHALHIEEGYVPTAKGKVFGFVLTDV
jgi:hypothetical protein